MRTTRPCRFPQEVVYMARDFHDVVDIENDVGNGEGAVHAEEVSLVPKNSSTRVAYDHVHRLLPINSKLLSTLGT